MKNVAIFKITVESVTGEILFTGDFTQTFPSGAGSSVISAIRESCPHTAGSSLANAVQIVQHWVPGLDYARKPTSTDVMVAGVKIGKVSTGYLGQVWVA